MSRDGHIYTDEQVSYLTEMCKTQASYREITMSFNARYGTNVSRSAVLGKCDRLGIRADKTSSKGERAKPVRSKRTAPLSQSRLKPSFGTVGVSPRSPARRAADVTDGPLLREENDRGDGRVQRSSPVDVDTMFDDTSVTQKPFLELRKGECRWPASNDASMACAGKATIGSYCTRHGQIAYRTMPTRRRNERLLAGGGLLDTVVRGEVVGDEPPLLALPSFLPSAPSTVPEEDL